MSEHNFLQFKGLQTIPALSFAAHKSFPSWLEMNDLMHLLDKGRGFKDL